MSIQIRCSEMIKTKNILILVTFLALTIGTITLAQDTITEPSIYYGGVVVEDSGAYKFTYTVISRTPIVKRWTLTSSFFERLDVQFHITAEDQVEDSTIFEPLYIHTPISGTLEIDHSFDHPFNTSLTRIYDITVSAASYTGLVIDYIDYEIFWPTSDPLTGTIEGPIDTEEIIEPPPWYNNIPPLTIPLGFLILALIAWRQKWF